MQSLILIWRQSFTSPRALGTATGMHGLASIEAEWLRTIRFSRGMSSLWESAVAFVGRFELTTCGLYECQEPHDFINRMN